MLYSKLTTMSTNYSRVLKRFRRPRAFRRATRNQPLKIFELPYLSNAEIGRRIQLRVKITPPQMDLYAVTGKTHWLIHLSR